MNAIDSLNVSTRAISLPSSRVVEWAIRGLGISVAVLLGILAFTRGAEAIVFMMLPFAALLVLTRPAVGMLLLAFTVPLQNVITFDSGLTGIKLLGMIVFGAWLLHKLYRRSSWSDILHTPFFVAAAGFLVLALLSTLWAEFPEDAYTPLFQLLQLLLWGLLLVDVANSWDRADSLAKVLVLAGLIAAFFTVEQFFLSGARRAGDGVAGGVDATATMIVSLIPFAFYLTTTRDTRIWRSVGLLYIMFAIVAVAVTFSRMNFLVLPLLIIAQYWETLRARGLRLWHVMLVTLILVTILWLPWDLVQSRIDTIGPYLTETLYGISEEQPEATSARGFHLKVGLEIFRDHPLIGVGYNNYGAHFLYDYQFRVPGAFKVWTSKRSPHSSHIGLLAEFGTFGYLVWLALLGVGTYNFTRAWINTRERKSSRQHLIVQAAAYSFLAQVVAYGWYANIHTDKLFWALLGLSVVFRRLSATPGFNAQFTQ